MEYVNVKSAFNDSACAHQGFGPRSFCSSIAIIHAALYLSYPLFQKGTQRCGLVEV